MQDEIPTLAGSVPLDPAQGAELQRSTAAGARRIFGRFVALVLGLQVLIGLGMVVYDVGDTIDTTEYLLESSGERLVEVVHNLRRAEPTLADEQVVARAAQLTGVPMALVTPAGAVPFATSPRIAGALPRVVGVPLTPGGRAAIREELGELSGVWIVAPFVPARHLLVIVPRRPQEEGLLRYMTVSAALLGLGAAMSLLFMLLFARWVLHQPLHRLVRQLTGALVDDIAQRARAEQAAVAARLEAEQHLAFRDNLLNASQEVGIVAADRDDVVQLLNRAGEQILRLSAAEIEGRVTLDELIAGLERPAAEPLPKRSLMQLAGGESFAVDATGRERLLQRTIAEISDGEGQRSGRLMIFFDVTQRKQLEVDLHIHEMQLVQAAKMASLGEMATGIAHELNQPLNNIALLCSRMSQRAGALDGATGAFLRERLQKIDGQVQRASRIIDQLRTFGRPRGHETAVIDVCRPVRGVLELLRQQLVDRGITLAVDLPPGLPLVEVDEGHLEQVLVNLLNNARDAVDTLPVARHDRRVALRCAAAERAGRSVVLLQVSDNGPGMPAEVADRIFEPFFTTKDVGKGTGLGLSISYGLVEGFGGKLELETKPGEGTTFTVVLPVRHAGGLADAARGA